MRDLPESRSRDALSRAIAASRTACLVVAGFSAVINVLCLTIPIYMMQVFDRVLTSRSFDTLVLLTMIATAAAGLHALLEFLRSRLLFRVSGFLDQALSLLAFERAIAGIQRGQAYAVEALRDLATLRGFIGGAGIAAIVDAPWTPVFLVAIWMIHPALGTFAAIGATLLLVVAALNEAATRTPLRESGLAHMRAMKRIEAAGRGAELLMAMGMTGDVGRSWAADVATAADLQERVSRRGATLLAIAKFLRLVLQVGMLAIGGWLVVRQELAAGAMVAASLLLGRALSPVEQAIGAWRSVVAARAAHDRLRRFFAESSDTVDAMPLPALEGQVEVETLSYAAPGSDRLILKGVGFALRPGQVLAIIGPSGTGKSTLARLLVGLLRPTAGNVRLDGADAWLWNRDDLGRAVGFLPQTIDLFAGTIARNIARMGDGDPREIVRAAKIAGINDMVLRLPRGYDTEIGDGGNLLSAGQRQRIALARAIYGRPKLLVLDEPNSNLDFEGEEALARAVRQIASEGSTVVLITHRASLLDCADQVVALREGAVWLAGERASVLEQLRSRDSKSSPRPRLQQVDAR